MKILVTGGAGFIGSAVVRYIIKNTSDSVINLDKLTYAGNLESLREVADNPRYSFVRADICNRPTLDNVFQSYQPDAVMHLAAESHVDRSIDGPAAFIETNITGTYNLLESALAYWRSLHGSEIKGQKAEVFRFLHVSTDEVYGSLGKDGYFSEHTAYDPRSPYSASKAASDHLVMAWYHTYGLPVLMTNCSNNYGPYHFPEKLIPLIILNAIEGKKLPVYGRGDNIRDWLYVDDHARALLQVLKTGEPGQSYNIGGVNERTNLEVVEMICDILDEIRPLNKGVDGPPSPITHHSSPDNQNPQLKLKSRRDLITFVPDRPGHDKRYAVDTAKIRKELGWEPKETFATGLRKTIQWYLDNTWWWAPLRDQRYAGERLGQGYGAKHGIMHIVH